MGANMAQMLAKKHQVRLYDRHLEKAKALADEIGAVACSTVGEAVQDADYILLCVKPQDLKEVSASLFGKVRDSQTVVSILAGVQLSTLSQHLGSVKLLRMLPNTACAYGKGIVAIVEEKNGNSKEVEEVFSDLGRVIWVPEKQANAVSALGGSGLAFVFMIVESFVDAGLAMGLQAEQAKTIALEMITGAVEVMNQTGKSPSELKWQVTSPAGCTIAGVKQMEDESVRSGLINTILATHDRFLEME